MGNQIYVKCGCVEEVGLSSSPILCADCNFSDDTELCELTEREYYIYKKVE